jgi:class 3 adenylate cyclase/tetratricopeptide (TPR) repeat protein
MPTIKDWLASLGMSEYEGRFVEHGIDFDVLTEIDDSDLEKIGVLLGHRRKILRGIRALSRLSPDKGAPEPSDRRATTVFNDGERRQLTVMFVDLVGFTALSSRSDPEELREIIAAYHRCCTNVITGERGFVAKYMGDGILAYFGYPHAREHDAEAAVRAALALVEAVSKLRVGDKLQVRIGIATGLVIVGDLIGDGHANEPEIIGDVPNLAARLQTVADPETIVIAEETRRLVGTLFDLQTLPSQQIKGFSFPVQAYVVLRSSSEGGRSLKARSGLLTELLGREKEVSFLLEQWRLSATDEGRVVLLCGDPGIGKSRLVAALLDTIAPRQCISYFCSPHHTHSALYPIISQMTRAADFQPGDDVATKLRKLTEVLAQSSTPAEERELFAELLSLRSETLQNARLTSLERRNRTIEALHRRLKQLTSHGPALVIVEDAQWIDPTSLDVLNKIISGIAAMPVLLIVTFRSDFSAPWNCQANVTTVVLDRLAQQDCRNLVRRVVSAEVLSAELVDEIVARADGVPLFVEEMTKALLETAAASRPSSKLSSVSIAQLDIPATLHGLLLTRLDQMGEAKVTAQIGAAIGREFSFELLSAVSEIAPAKLVDSLGRLLSVDLLVQTGSLPRATFTFKHALFQDAAYSTLLRSARRILHRRIAQTMHEGFAEMGESQPELLAHHYSEADDAASAVTWWTRACERGLRVSAYRETLSYVEHGIGISQRLNSASDQRRSEVRFLTLRGQALFHSKGQAAPETIAAFAQARELAATASDDAEKFSIYWGLWTGSFARAELRPMHEIAGTFLREALDRPDMPELSVAYRLWGITQWFAGDYLDARESLEQALATHDPKSADYLASRFGYREDIIAKCCLATIVWPLGETALANRLIAEALQAASESAHAPAIAIAHTYAYVIAELSRSSDQVASLAKVVVDLSREHGLPLFLTAAMSRLAWARWWEGDEAAEAEFTAGLLRFQEIDFRIYGPHNAILLAELQARSGRSDAALESLDRQVNTIEITGERWIESEIYRVRGDILLLHKPADLSQAERAFNRALQITRQQGTRVFELRAALSLAKLHRAREQNRVAANLLKATLAGLNGATDLPEVREASGILESLHSAS